MRQTIASGRRHSADAIYWTLGDSLRALRVAATLTAEGTANESAESPAPWGAYGVWRPQRGWALFAIRSSRAAVFGILRRAVYILISRSKLSRTPTLDGIT